MGRNTRVHLGGETLGGPALLRRPDDQRPLVACRGMCGFDRRPPVLQHGQLGPVVLRGAPIVRLRTERPVRKTRGFLPKGPFGRRAHRRGVCEGPNRSALQDGGVPPPGPEHWARDGPLCGPRVHRARGEAWSWPPDGERQQQRCGRILRARQARQPSCWPPTPGIHTRAVRSDCGSGSDGNECRPPPKSVRSGCDLVCF
mmetsp:Transcript_41220/g.86224  ORF Transcript_41220/g.86224 Transcript_41220/m.86224 type:complete len:200 (+) Transcript_41220:1223-1822(+)